MRRRPSHKPWLSNDSWLKPGSYVKDAVSHVIFKVIGPAPSKDFHYVYGEAIAGETMKQSLLVADLQPLDVLEQLAVEGL